jgi:molybdopterin-containing oxidoreductase family iron-sulfur binding subunit
MKRIWQHPEEPNNAKRYWRSTAELEQRSEFLNKAGVEFPLGDTLSEEEQENSRREFLKVMGAATGLMGMGLASCRRPEARILPYTNHVEWVIPGKPLLYASAMPLPTGGAAPLVVTTHEGRPTHLQGNTLHPLGGGLDSFAQASILDLYDPERSQSPAIRGKKVQWTRAGKVMSRVAAEAKKQSGKGFAILVGNDPSPTSARLLAELKASMPNVALFGYEAASNPAAKAAQSAIFGRGGVSFVRFSKAERILALDADFLGLDPVAGESIKEFTKKREKDDGHGSLNRLYALENRYTLTGGMADHRKPLAASLIPVAAAVIAAELGEASAKKLAGSAPESLKSWLGPAIRDLQDHKGKSVVIAGSRQPAEVHYLVAAINQALGAYGPVVELLKGSPTPPMGSIGALHKAVKDGEVTHIVSLTPSNPLLDAPAADALAKAIRDKAVNVIQWGLQNNSSAQFADLHLPAAHYLEAWGDVRSADGTYSVIQPMIQPLHGGVSEIEVLLALLGRKTLGPAPEPVEGEAAPAETGEAEDAAYAAVRDTFAKVAGAMDEKKWNFTLRDGFLKGSAFAKGGVVKLGGVAGAVAKAKAPKAPTADSLEVVLVPDAGIYDGRYANNAWLQEAPDPVTKLTWDNAAWVGAALFRDLKLKTGQMIKLTSGDIELVVPAVEAPGHVSNSITLPMGYGEAAGLGYVGGGRGFNVFPLRRSPGGFVISDVSLEVQRDTYELAITQDHNTMEGRAVYREGTEEQFDETPDFAQKTGMDGHIPENISFYKGQVGVKSEKNPSGFDYENEHQWGMSIDLSKCIGCTACVVACQSENNIPVVGKEQVAMGRIMQWIRMDRYFAVSKWGENDDKADDVMRDPTAEQLENSASPRLVRLFAP